MLRTALLIGAVALTACATTGKRRVVKLADTTPIQTTSVRFDTPEAAAACDTRKMRTRALDADTTNDIASITVLREISPGRRTETDIDVNCRDYFASRLGGNRTVTQAAAIPQTETRIIVREAAPVAPVTTFAVVTEPVQQTYRVRRGDTLYDIARSHCTGWKTLADANGIRDAARIKPGQVLRLPEGGC